MDLADITAALVVPADTTEAPVVTDLADTIAVPRWAVAGITGLRWVADGTVLPTAVVVAVACSL